MGHKSRISALLGLALALLFAGDAFAADPAPKSKKKIWYTYPMPPHVKPADPLLGAPGQSIPENHASYVWKVTAPKNESTITQVPVYSAGWNGRLSKVGNVPLGTEVKLDEVRVAGRSHLYSLKFIGKTGKEQLVWIDGRYLAAAGPATLAPVQ